MQPVDGGFQAVRIEGSGTDRVDLRAWPSRLEIWALTSLVAAVLIVSALVFALLSWIRAGARFTHTGPGTTFQDYRVRANPGAAVIDRQAKVVFVGRFPEVLQ